MSTNDDVYGQDGSFLDVDLIEVDDLLNSASRLLEEVYSTRPIAAIQTSPLNPREDAKAEVQRFLNSIRETQEEDDVVFVEARSSNALPANARIRAVIDLRSSDSDDESTPVTCTTRKRRRQSSNFEPIKLPAPKNTSSVKLPALTCAVCMEIVINRQPTSTDCGHIFCQACIKQAIRFTMKCPLCNRKLSATQIHRVYF